MSTLDQFERRYREFSDSALLLTGEEDRAARRAFAEEICTMLEKHPDSRSLYHKLGLCLYDMTDWESEDKWKIESSFHRALLLDAESIFSRMFLVFFYFDTREYALALTCADRLLTSDMRGRIPFWRIVKVRSLKLACQIHLGRLEGLELREQLKLICELYASLDDEDVEDAEPAELVEALTSHPEFWRDEAVAARVESLRKVCAGKV